MLIIFTGCNLIVIKGSGNIQTSAQNLPAFTQVMLHGSGSAVIRQGNQPGIVIQADDNILPLIMADVHGERLDISIKPGLIHSAHIEYEITTPSLESVDISGSGQIQLESVFDNPSLSVNVSGSGQMEAEVQNDTVSADISGSGRIRIAGSTEVMTASISGSGRISAMELTAADAKVDISGSGQCQVHADRTLNVSISGSGQLMYSGSPAVTSSVSGSGSIKAVGG